MPRDLESIEALAEGLFRVRAESMESVYSVDDRLDRDTLFVGSPGTNSERIVTYNSGKLIQIDKPARESVALPPLPVTHNDVIDCDACEDGFTVARFLLSRLLAGTDHRYVRFRVSLDNKGSLTAVIDSIIIASNVSRIACTIYKPSGYSDSVTLLAYNSPTKLPFSSYKTIPSSLSENSGSLASVLFHTIHEQDDPIQMILSSEVENVVRIASVICSETKADLSLLSLDLEPTNNSDVLTAVQVRISKVEPHTRNQQLCEILESSDAQAADSHDFRERLSSLTGSYIYLSLTEQLEVSQLTSILIRLFLGGYCGVSLDLDPSSSAVCSRRVWECMLVLVKYFDLSFRLCKGPNIVITRKCLTIDPAVVPEPVNAIGKDIVEFGESSSLLAIGSCVLTALSKSGDCKIALSRSVPLATGLCSVLVQASENCEIRLRTAGKKTIVMGFKSEKNIDTNDISEYLTQLGGDVSPSNYKPVDASLRHGSAEEILNLRTQLRALVPGESKRFSLLLVGPWNIGAGVRVIAEEASQDNAPVYEFVSERAVRDSAGLTLKCAARIFVRKALDARIDLEELMRNCSVVDVIESDSRITVANKLFTLLNEAPASNPYVLIRAEGDYCTFIAAMSVVVANGWSRTIQQRVETRVMKDHETTVFYITRLIVNSLYN